jgi:hypothetical protein
MQTLINDLAACSTVHPNAKLSTASTLQKAMLFRFNFGNYRILLVIHEILSAWGKTALCIKSDLIKYNESNSNDLH